MRGSLLKTASMNKGLGAVNKGKELSFCCNRYVGRKGCPLPLPSLLLIEPSFPTDL